MTSIPDHYAALGIDPTADPEVITAAYRALAKKFHPDTGAAGGTASPERFDEIQKAYEVLRNPESRHAYDLELLAATEAELEHHLASKRRVAVRERQAEAEQAAAPPPPDLGDIRPEPSMPPKAAPHRGKPRRSGLPYAIPLVLMMALGGGVAWMLLPDGPAAPPLPAESSTETSNSLAKQNVASDAPAATSAAQTAGTSPDQVAAAPAAAPAPAASQDSQPVFGSTATDAAAMQVAEADDTPAKSDKPSFGSTLEGEAPVVAPAASEDATAGTATAEVQPPPVPKPKPAQPNRQALQKPVKKPAPAQQKTALNRQSPPPQYNAQPDGYPPPGYPTPGYEPPGYDASYDPRAQYDPPPGFEDDYPPPGLPGGMAGKGPYRLVIFERQPGRQATAWSAGVVFKSIGKCTRQGVKAVLRRTAGTDPESLRVWYECQQLSQR